MEHPFFPTTTTRAEALRWLSIAEKLLSTRDFLGSKSFATRARDSDPTLTHADQILAVADTLLVGERRIGNNQPDWYSILRLTPPQARDAQLVDAQYRNLVILLNPQMNNYPFAEQAFRLAMEAYSVLSNPVKKSMYDKELAFYLQQQQHQSDPFSNTLPTMQQNLVFFGGSAAAACIPQPQPSVHVGGIGTGLPNQFAQVNAGQPRVEPGLTREPSNFVNFNSASNFVFGSGSGSSSGSGVKSSNEQVYRPVLENVTGFAGVNVGFASVQNQQSVINNCSNKPKQPFPQESFINGSDKTNPNVNVTENGGEGREDEVNVEGMGMQDDEEAERVDEPVDEGETFWTACPYCYYMYEYPRIYVDCSMRCETCKMAFEAVMIPSPPVVEDGQEGTYSCWAFFPMGISMEKWKEFNGASGGWAPFSPLFVSPPNKGKRGARKNSGPWVYIDDDEAYSGTSDSSDDSDADWRYGTDNRNKKTKTVRKGASGTPNKNVNESKQVNGQRTSSKAAEMRNNTAGEQSKKGATVSARKQPSRGAKNFGRLDLNVELSNEAEEHAPRVKQGNGPVRGEDENIEGNGFFEGLDDFFSNLPIPYVAEGVDKVVEAA